MRKIVYTILISTVIVSIVVFWEVQQLRSEDFKEGVNFFVDRILEKDKYVGSTEVFKRNEKRKTHILEVAFAINSYKKINDSYPSNPDVSGSLTGSGIFSEELLVNPIYPEYLNIPPKDPINNSYHHYTYISKDNNFVLFARLEWGEDDIAEKYYYCIDSVSRNPMIVHSNPSMNMRCE